MQHSIQKLFGMLGGNSVELFSLFWFAGIIEFFGGLSIALGLFTKIVASIAALEMLVAYFYAHVGILDIFTKKLQYIPILNGGELALLYFAAFLVLAIYGAKKWSLDIILSKRNF
jgi:putative oxidoreductase|tara:strand:- start:80342 stop:80686 length:345 start_codon:yes stop_codon:yes gene_type:complete